MSSQPSVSFVIPYYHKIKSIRRCLQSLQNQSEKNIEIIVVFDGADAEAEAIVAKFKNVRRITIPHGGAPAARNAGAKIATGKYISFWDADCYIESGAVNAWLLTFKKYPEVDFVYAGYRFVPEGCGGIAGEPFDPWLLQVNNYISGMFPIKREKAPKWDESLKSLQDWDFWLTAVENGCKGQWMQGYSFKTDFPEPKSISGQGTTPENWLPRMETVKNKHKIPLRDICVSAIPCQEEGKQIAKMIDADYRDMPLYFPNKYKTIVQIGFDPKSADVHASNFKNGWGDQPKRILFWRAQDIYTLRNGASMAAVEALSISINSAVDFQFCEDKIIRDALQRMNFKAVCLPLPMDFSGEKDKPLPPKLMVLMDVEPEYRPLFESIERALPDVTFRTWKGPVNVDDFSILVKFSRERSIDTGVKKMLLAGRRVISNIQAPFCGYVSAEVESVEKTRKAIIKTLREMQDEKKLNKDAQAFYRESCSPKKFVDVLTTICKLKDEKKVLVGAK
jgi:Glycosyl transferase family 2